VATPQAYISGFATEKRSQRSGKTKWPLGVTIENFLPLFGESPIGLEGITRVGGEPCALALQNRLRYYVSLSAAAVLRTEALAPKGHIWRIEDFSSFVPASGDIYFPRIVQQQINDRLGNFVKAFTIFVDAVETNVPVDERLFDVSTGGGVA
jgi:hypothetical protein